MQRVFELRGRLRDDSEAAAVGVVVAIVDRDPFYDDLIGVAVSDDAGSFRLSFTHAAFNQESFEDEGLPDLCLVFSHCEGGKLTAFHQLEFGELKFVGVEDLGEIRLPLPPQGKPQPIAALEALPGGDKRAVRLAVDDAVVAHSAAEVLPLVESLTGWSGLMDQTSFAIAPTPLLAWQRVEAQVGNNVPGYLQQKLVNAALEQAGMLALYDPFTRTIVVARSVAETQNLDGLKVILGHELVHAGQFQHHPELVDEYRAHLQRLCAAQAAPVERRLAESVAAQRAGIGLMANIEGHAYHVEKDFLRKVYNSAVPLKHTGFFTEFLAALISGAAGEESFRGLDPYALGREAYRARAQGSRPAAFDPRFRVPLLDAPPS